MNDESELAGPQRSQNDVDLDVLRGWSEHRDPALQKKHHLPALASFVLLDEDDQPLFRYRIYGPDILVGRFQARYAPVDLLFSGIEDQQIFRLGAPHAHLSCDFTSWKFQVLSPRSTTLVDGQPLEHLHKAKVLTGKEVITLGVTRFRFETDHVASADWRAERQNLLDTLDSPALFLKRSGGICGVYHGLSEDEPLVVGRSFPKPGQLGAPDIWPVRDENFWDLSGLYDFERRYIAFRHAQIEKSGQEWTIAPLSTRQRIFVNRIAISEKVTLTPGDEIGLGSILFHFHHPAESKTRQRQRHVPAVVDWSEGRRLTPTPTEKKP